MIGRTFIEAARALPYLQTADARLATAVFCQCLSQPCLCRRTACHVTPFSRLSSRRVLDCS